MPRTGRPPGTKQSPETREKHRRLAIQRWQDPEYRARHLPLLAAAGELGRIAREAKRVPKVKRSGPGRPRVRPPRGTPEYRLYCKVALTLGIEAARSMKLEATS